MYLCGGSPDFFYFHIWTTEVISYNALNLEFANFETPCIILNELLFYEFAPATDRDIFKRRDALPHNRTSAQHLFLPAYNVQTVVGMWWEGLQSAHRIK
jgi:hypothetical protein